MFISVLSNRPEPAGRCRAVLWGSIGLVMMGAISSAAAFSPVPFFREVSRVGVLCLVRAPDTGSAPDSERLCAWAAQELGALLAPSVPGTGVPVAALAPNDERLADPAALTVLLGAQALTGSGGPPLLALAAGLHRARPELGPPPFFPAPPEAVVLDGEAEAAIRAALRRLLDAAVARPLRSGR